MSSSADSAGASVRVITGPTASGKSALALDLARELPVAILSADSRQVYRGFDIGTAKPRDAERAAVPHFGIDVVEPTVRYSAAAWAAGAVEWMREARAMGREPLIVGGTGFYLRALAEPLFDEPPLDAARRDALGRTLAAMPTGALRDWCRALDPARAGLGRAQLLRAIEIALLTGVPLSTWHRRAARPPVVRARYLLIDRAKGLRERIDARVDAMFDAGWVEETRELARVVPPDAPAWNATGYRAIRELVNATETNAGARHRVKSDTWQYARRQRTWFRNQLAGADVTCLDPEAPGALARALAWWHSSSEP